MCSVFGFISGDLFSVIYLVIIYFFLAVDFRAVLFGFCLLRQIVARPELEIRHEC